MFKPQPTLVSIWATYELDLMFSIHDASVHKTSLTLGIIVFDPIPLYDDNVFFITTKLVKIRCKFCIEDPRWNKTSYEPSWTQTFARKRKKGPRCKGLVFWCL